MGDVSAVRDLLRLTLTSGFGPVLIRRALETFGSPAAVLSATPGALTRIRGVGDDRARQIAQSMALSERLADDELALAHTLGVDLLGLGSPAFPPLLASIPNAPVLLYVRGELQHAAADRYPIAIVGSRSCSHYAIEQAERFGLHLAQAGLTIVSGGARGVDTAAHRGALRAKGRTVAVLGCGLAECYPPENRDLFDRISAGHGCVISELPLRTPPNAENFPARNRIISGLSLGVLVVEAGKKSGALITVRTAVEEHGREAFALPARVDSAHAEGSLELLKSGGAQLVTHPDDILHALETPARHLFAGSHQVRYAPTMPDSVDSVAQGEVAPSRESAPARAHPPGDGPRDAGLTPAQRAIVEALDAPRTIDDLGQRLGMDIAKLRTDITVLELKRRIVRRGSAIERRDSESRLA